MTADRRRVVESHRIAAAALRLAAVFGLVALGWSAVVLAGGGSWWGPVHAFLAGTVLLAISGTAQMFTITWATAPSPPRWMPATQRWAVTVGVALALIGVVRGLAVLAVAGALAAIVGLALLGMSLVGAVRRSLLRRFDLSSRFYLLAVASGVGGIALGGLMGGGIVTGFDAVVVHAHLNLVGLMGLTIAGTLPTFLPTLAHRPAVSGREAVAALWAGMGSVVLMTSGLVLGPAAVAAGTFLAGLALVLVLAGIVLRLGRRGPETGGPAYLQVAVGTVWLVVWAAVDAADLAFGSPGPVLRAWTAAAVVAGVGQVLTGSLAYLVPVLAGPAPRLGRNLDRMAARPWLPVAAANTAGVALVASWPWPAVVAGAVWVTDLAVRLVRLERRGADPGGA